MKKMLVHTLEPAGDIVVRVCKKLLTERRPWDSDRLIQVAIDCS